MESLAALAADNWFDLLQSLGIVASVFFATRTFGRDHKARLVENRIRITGHHRELQLQLSERPELRRVYDPLVNLEENPVTFDEELFVKLTILHLNAHFYATGQRLLTKPEGLRADVAGFFALPVPRTVWENTKNLRDKKFALFVDGILSSDLS